VELVGAMTSINTREKKLLATFVTASCAMIQLEEYIVLTLQVLISNVVTAFINAATDRPMKNSDRPSRR